MRGSSESKTSLSPLKRALQALEDMQSRLDAMEYAAREPIALIGMGCRFPAGCDTPEAFWQMLRDGVDGIGEVPADRWDADAYYDPDPETSGKMCTRHGGFLKQVHDFDAHFFGHSSIIDPWGETIVEGDEEEALLTAEIDLDQVAEVRHKIPVFEDRRPETY